MYPWNYRDWRGKHWASVGLHLVLRLYCGCSVNVFLGHLILGIGVSDSFACSGDIFHSFWFPCLVSQRGFLPCLTCLIVYCFVLYGFCLLETCSFLSGSGFGGAVRRGSMLGWEEARETVVKSKIHLIFYLWKFCLHMYSAQHM